VQINQSINQSVNQSKETVGQTSGQRCCITKKWTLAYPRREGGQEDDDKNRIVSGTTLNI
jgi:hypothetical protein